MNWKKIKPGIYHRGNHPASVGSIERGGSGWWWWIVVSVAGKQQGAGRCLRLREAKDAADKLINRSHLKVV
jgi:hypothetical protein